MDFVGEITNKGGYLPNVILRNSYRQPGYHMPFMQSCFCLLMKRHHVLRYLFVNGYLILYGDCSIVLCRAFSTYEELLDFY